MKSKTSQKDKNLPAQIGEAPRLKCKRRRSTENDTSGTSADKLVAKNTVNEEFNEDDEFRPLSGKPYFIVLLTKSHIKPAYRMIIPSKIHSALPIATLPAMVTYRGKTWKTTYLGEETCRKFDATWRAFVIDNNLNAGDALLFELTECNSEDLKFEVEILRDYFPPEVLAKVNGASSDTAILLD